MLPKNKNWTIVFACILFIFWTGPIALAGESNLLIRFYQEHISAVDGNRCPMYPSCSTYASQAFERHGPVLGWIITCDRLVRCGRDESQVSIKVGLGTHEFIYDPVSANDFWWFENDQN